MIKVIKTGINVSKVVEQLKKYPQDWDHQKTLEGSQSLVDRGFADLPTSALQLLHTHITMRYERLYASNSRMQTFIDAVFFHFLLMRLLGLTLMKEHTI